MPDTPELFTDTTAIRRWVRAIGGPAALAAQIAIAPRTAERIYSGKFRLRLDMARTIAAMAGEQLP